MIHLVEALHPVQGTLGAVTSNGGVTCDYVSLKNVNMAWIVAHFDQAVAHATVIQPQKATAVAPTGAISITTSVPNWENGDCAASDTLTKNADATSSTLAATVKTHMVVFQIDPAQLGSTYDVMGCTISNSGQATDLVSVVYYLEMAYQQAAPPTVLTD
jgi:hypothetical protein